MGLDVVCGMMSAQAISLKKRRFVSRVVVWKISMMKKT